MIKFYYKKEGETTLTEIPQPQVGCWIHIDEAVASDLLYLSAILGISPSFLSDTIDKYEVPRLEKTKETTAFFTRYPCDLEAGLYTSVLTFILTASYFVTISPHKCLIIETFLATRPTFSPIPFLMTDYVKLLVSLLHKINYEFTSHIKRVRYNVLSAEKEMIYVESDDIAILTKHEEILNQYLASLIPIYRAFGLLKAEVSSRLEAPETLLLENLLTATQQSQDLCSVMIKSITSLRDAYQIIFTNNLHKTIKLLTSLTIILSIPTMMASIYGMNVPLPLEHSRFAFLFVTLITIGISVIALWIFKKMRWL